MSNDYSTPIFIMLITMLATITILGIRLDGNQDDCPDCPTPLEMNSNATSKIILDITNKRDCIEQYPFGYYHSIINNKCHVVIWTTDLDKPIGELTNDN